MAVGGAQTISLGGRSPSSSASIDRIKAELRLWGPSSNVNDMGRGVPRFLRRATAALALCGVLAYSGLFPGHIVSQLVTDLGEHGFSVAAKLDCHDEGGPANQQPSNGAKKHCPFCSGDASFQVAAIGSPTLVIPPQVVVGDVLAIEDDMALHKSAVPPQSRGPPFIPV